MDPIPATGRAIEKLERLEEMDVGGTLTELADRVVAVAPDCVGMSLTLVEQGVTLTMVDRRLEGPPADDTPPVSTALNAKAGAGRGSDTADDPFDEQRWSQAARATAAAGVLSTLSLPLVDDDRVVGDIDLYGATRDAFDGHVWDLARSLHTDAASAVRDADLPFATRQQALRAPQILADQAAVGSAVGIISHDQHVDLFTAQVRLEQAADRAGVSVLAAAHTVIQINADRHPRSL